MLSLCYNLVIWVHCFWSRWCLPLKKWSPRSSSMFISIPNLVDMLRWHSLTPEIIVCSWRHSTFLLVRKDIGLHCHCILTLYILEHILILAAPIYMIYSRRYPVLPPSPSMALLSFFIYGFFHTPLLHACALKSGLNLNYLFAPPPGESSLFVLAWVNFLPHTDQLTWYLVKILVKLGPLYRPAMYCTALVAMFATRYLLVGGIMSVLPRKALLM